VLSSELRFLFPLLSHRKLSNWYHQLAQQAEAGLMLADALRASQGTGLPTAGIEAMAALIERGGSIDDAFGLSAPWLPTGDRLVLSAAAQVGRMPRALHSLSLRHAEIGKAKRRVLFACFYPLALLHLGLLLLPLMRMVDWNKGFAWDPLVYLRMVTLLVVPLWSVGIAVVIAIRRENPVITGIARHLPMVGGFLRNQGLSDFAFALGNFLNAGMHIDRAWTVAGSIARLPSLRNAAKTVARIIARGEQPGQTLSTLTCFPPDFVALYKSGETTGQLDENLLRLSAQYQEQASQSLRLATFVYPSVVFLVVAIAMVYQAVRFYAGYLKMIENLAG
jgi:type II secretory pathway component PulF